MYRKDSFSLLEGSSFLQRIHPPTDLIVVGAGSGGSVVREWGDSFVPRVLLIEANPDKCRSLEQLTHKYPGWNAIEALVGDSEETAEFYFGTNWAMNGIVPMRVLKQFWQNLRQTGKTDFRIFRLDKLLGASLSNELEESSVWLDIDCFPSLPIVKSASERLSSFDIVRCSFLTSNSHDVLGEPEIETVSEYLRGYGFIRVVIEHTNHPMFIRALFMKDWKSISFSQEIKLSTIEDGLEREKKEQHHLKNAMEEYRKVIAHHELQVRQTASELETLQSQSGAWAEKLDQITQAHDEQRGLAEKLQYQVGQMAQERDKHRKEAEQLRGKLIQLTNERDKLRADVAQNVRERNEFEERKRQLDGEMIKAEAQIELIKDVLIRDKAF